MSFYFGVDTSNYTTSFAVYNKATNNIISLKELLPVKVGEKGLRQNDAVFYHSKALPLLIDKAYDCYFDDVKAIGVADKPRNIANSYMPCFSVGEGYAKVLSKALNVPLLRFSHQQGHIAAAVYSSKRSELLSKRFIAFHISGGTTEALLFTPSDSNIADFKLEIVGKTLDLNAGQLIDRVGVMLGLPFPAGKGMEKLSCNTNPKSTPKPVLKGTDICLSGFQNKAEDMFKEQISNACIASYILEAIQLSLDKMVESLIKKYGELPLLFAGGVMSNNIYKKYFQDKYGAYFAEPEYSSDNAAGISYLSALKTEGL